MPNRSSLCRLLREGSRARVERDAVAAVAMEAVARVVVEMEAVMDGTVRSIG